MDGADYREQARALREAARARLRDHRRERAARSRDGTETAPAPGVADAAAPSLEALPGMGPGLAWLLREAGLRDPADLRALDAATLARRLGVVARLIDLPALRALAEPRAGAR